MLKSIPICVEDLVARVRGPVKSSRDCSQSLILLHNVFLELTLGDDFAVLGANAQLHRVQIVEVCLNPAESVRPIQYSVRQHVRTLMPAPLGGVAQLVKVTRP